MRRTNWIWLVGYLAAMVVVVSLTLWGRDVALREMDTPEAHADWQTWRDAPPNQRTDGPVRRRPPVVGEPPALLLMRDHFPVVISGAVIFSSLLFAAGMMAVRGAFSPRKTLGVKRS